MRRAFVVAVLLAMMVGLRKLQIGNHAAADPLTLATIGFVVLAAFSLAELGGHLQLPRVTGFILAGVSLGPHALNIMSPTVVGDMKMFNALALGLIATTAGLELDLAGLRRLARTLGATIAVKVALGVLVVGGTFFAVESNFHVLGLTTVEERLALAVVFAVLSIGTSPAIALAILSETSAKGRLADLVLGAAVVKDLVVVVCLAVAVATARALTGGGELGVDVLTHVGEELGASILGGSILGVLLIAYLRWVKAEMLLFVAAMVLVVAEISAALHLELLLVFIVAGLVVRNFSEHEHDLLPPLQKVSLPVFVVFFTNAGASVDIAATLSVLPLALAMCLARVVSYITASRVGGRFGGETPVVRRLAWLGYLPQAGVTLGLTGLAAGQLGGQLGNAVTTLGMALVALNLLIGPVTLRAALRRAGEVPDAPRDAATSAEAAAARSYPAAAALADPGLRNDVASCVEHARAAARGWVEEVIAPRVAAFGAPLAEVLGDGPGASRTHAFTGLREAARAAPPPNAARLFSTLTLGCRALVDERRVPVEDSVGQARPGERWIRRANRRIWRMFAVLTRRVRRVPVQLVARTYLEPKYIEAAAGAQGALLRFEAAQVATLAALAAGELTREEALRTVQDQAARVVEELQRDLDASLDRAAAGLAHTLALVDTPELPLRKIRYSTVEYGVRAGLQQLAADAAAWPDRIDAAIQTALITAEIAEAREKTEAALLSRILEPLAEALRTVADTAGALAGSLHRLAGGDAEVSHDELDDEVQALRAITRKLPAALRHAQHVPTADTVVGAHTPELPDRAQMVPLAELRRAARPATIDPVEVSLRERVDAKIAADLIAPIDGQIERARAGLEVAAAQLVESVELVAFMARTVREAEVDASARARSQLDGLAGARARAEAIVASLDGRGEALAGAFRGAFEASYGALVALTYWTTSVAEPLAGGSRKPAGTHVRLAAIWRGLVLAVRGEAARYAELLRLRAEASRFDPADMRDFLTNRQRDREKVQGPALYEQLFSDAPIRDPVLFIANREELRAIVHAAREWVGDAGAGNAALVTGAAGSGKSSLLAVARTKIGLRHVVAVERRAVGRRESIVEALASRIGCEPDVEALVATLRGDRTLVIVDDLHTWLGGGPADTRDLDVLLSLMLRTAASAFWLLAIDRHGFELLRELAPLRGWFAQIMELERLGVATVAEVITARHGATHRELAYPDAGVLAGLRQASPAESFHTALTTRAGGNLRQVIRLWRVSASVQRDGKVALRQLDSSASGLPFWPSLDADALAVLSLLLRHGPQTTQQLARRLGFDPTRVTRLLVTASLVVHADDDHDIAPALRDDVEAALREAGVRA